MSLMEHHALHFKNANEFFLKLLNKIFSEEYIIFTLRIKNISMKICLFPGSFDPITNGHIDVIKRALPLFDKLIVGIGVNSSKQPMFDTEKRLQWIRECFKDEPKVSAEAYSGLTTEFCKNIGAQYILRGIRYVSDFEYEKSISDLNHQLEPNVETIFLTPSPMYSSVSSTLVRDVIRNHGNYEIFVPEIVRV